MQKYTQENAYILNSIDASGYNKDPQGPMEKLKFVHETLLNEYGWRIAQVGLLEALTDWIAGLPSSLNIDFENSKIFYLAVEWKRLPKDPSDTRLQNYLNKWFRFMAMRLLGLWRTHKIV